MSESVLFNLLNVGLLVVAIVAFLIFRQLDNATIAGYLVGYFHMAIAARVYFGEWPGD